MGNSIQDVRKDINKLSIYVNKFGEVEVPMDKITNRQEMLIQGQILRDVLTNKLQTMNDNIQEVGAIELKSIVDAVSMANDICLKAMGDHKDTPKVLAQGNTIKDAEAQQTSEVDQGLAQVVSNIKSRKEKEKEEAVDAELEDDS